MKNKVVLITGASSGIGLETARYLSEDGYKVIGVSRSYPKHSFEFDYFLCDITDESQVIFTKNQIEKKYGKIDCLVNSAGMGISGAIENTPLEEVKQIYQVNVFGQFLMTKHMISLLRNSSQPKIINISSIASEIALPFQAFYSMTKASIDAFTKALAVEVKPFGIQVGAILPGDIKTDFTKHRVQPPVIKENLYEERIKKSIGRMEKDEQNGMSPLVIAKKIHRLIRRKHIPLSSTAGISYKTIRILKKVLPEKLVYWLVGKLYG